MSCNGNCKCKASKAPCEVVFEASPYTETIEAMDSIAESLYDLVYGTPLEGNGSVVLDKAALERFDAILEELNSLSEGLGMK